MRTTIKFILHSALVVGFIALATAAFTPMAKAEHSQSTTGAWLVVVDWDVDGKPSIESQPVRYSTVPQCISASAAFGAYLQAYDPLRAYVSVCAYPDDATDLDEIIDRVIEDFRKYFQIEGQSI